MAVSRARAKEFKVNSMAHTQLPLRSTSHGLSRQTMTYNCHAHPNLQQSLLPHYTEIVSSFSGLIIQLTVIPQNSPSCINPTAVTRDLTSNHVDAGVSYTRDVELECYRSDGNRCHIQRRSLTRSMMKGFSGCAA